MIQRSSQSNSNQQIRVNNNTPSITHHYGLNRDCIFSVLLSFIPIISILFIYIIMNALLNVNSFLYILIVIAVFILANLISFVTLFSMMNFSVYWRSALLSNTFLMGFMLANQDSYLSIVCFGYYVMCLSFFHLSEFVFTAMYHEEVTTDSFLLNHSLEYGLAALASWTEFTIEFFIIPSIKLNLYARFIGLFLVLFGELFRKLAMYQAGTNFNHYIQEKKKRDHILVQTGVYSLARHPSYFGWFFWSIGTQILLANPICTILYTIATWSFFKSRILYEEFHLIKFFGKEYQKYQAKVWSGIPFVKGCIQYAEESLD